MKTFTSLAVLLGAVMLFTSAGPEPVAVKLLPGFSYGSPEVGSIDKLAFAPNGILLIGDTGHAQILALDTGDNTVAEKGAELDIGKFDSMVAGALGTTPDNVEITDLAVNPVSRQVYISVQTLDGMPALFRLKGDTLQAVPLANVAFAATSLKDPVAADAVDQRGRPLRHWAISDLMYHNGNVLVSGLSNKEFGSTFRSIPFPFENEQSYASLEIYHAAHGQFETHSPIKTFSVTQIEGKDYLLASYTCTPLVLFPMDELKDGTHQKGRTVAELGAGNSPVDMVWIEKGGEQFFVMSNTNRPVMRIPLASLAATRENLTEPVTDFGATRGLEYISVPMVNVLQMDTLDDEKVVYMQRTAQGELVLRTRPVEWM